MVHWAISEAGLPARGAILVKAIAVIASDKRDSRLALEHGPDVADRTLAGPQHLARAFATTADWARGHPVRPRHRPWRTYF